VASRSLALLTDTDASSRDDVVARDGSRCGAAAGAGAELSRLKWSGTALDDGLHAARAVEAATAAAMALHEVARAIGCSLPTAAVGGRITGLSLVEPARE